MLNLYNILTSIEHRFGHQSGLDESSGRKSTTLPNEIALRVYVVCRKYVKTQHVQKY